MLSEADRQRVSVSHERHPKQQWFVSELLQPALVGQSREGRARREEREVTMLVTNPEGTWRIASVTVWPASKE